MNNYVLHLGDCLEKMKELADGSVDMVLADPPYGTIAAKWDSVIPLDQMWHQLKRVTKRGGVIAMTCSQPFTTKLISSNMKMFKYCWIWDKKCASGFNYARFQPMRQHEDIAVFYDGKAYFNSEGEKYDKPLTYSPASKDSESSRMTRTAAKGHRYTATHRKKYSILRFDKIKRGAIHPTQKPVPLMSYLIKAYTTEGQTVLDFTMGSGSTGVACVETKRNFIGIEKDEGYFNIAKGRIVRAVEDIP